MARGQRSELRAEHAALFWHVVMVELGIGALIAVSPQLLAGPIYVPIQPYLGAVMVLCLGAGGLALAVVSGLAPARLAAVAAAVATVPCVVLATTFAARGATTGVIAYGVVAVALVVTAWLIRRGSRSPVRPFVVMTGVVVFLQGVSMLVAPQTYANAAVYGDLGRYLAFAAPAFMLGGAGLALSEARFAHRRSTESWPVLMFGSIVAVDLAVLVEVFATSASWTGVLLYAFMGVTLLLAVPRVSRDAPVLFAALAAAASGADLLTGTIVALGGPALAPTWSLVRPPIAFGTACVAAGYALAFHRRRPLRHLTLVLGLVGLAVGMTEAAVAAVVPARPSPDQLLGWLADGDLGSAAAAGAIALVVSALLLLALRAWKDARVLPILFVSWAATLVGIATLNILAFMLHSDFLLEVYGALAMREHGTIALGTLGVGLLALGLARLSVAPIGERVLGAIAALAILTLIRGFVSDGAVSHLFDDPVDLTRRGNLEEFAKARNLTLVTLAGVTAAAGILFTRTVTFPLRDLLAAIARARAGESRAQAQVEGDDEIGVVARSFNQLTRELADEADFNTAVRSAQSDLGEAIVILDEGEPRSWNAALATISGYTEPELQAMESILELWPPARRDEVAGLLRARANETFRVETVIRRRNGDPADVELAVQPLRDTARPQQLAILRDITAAQQARRALERLALHDPLTDLPNRALFADRLQRVIGAATRANDSFALLYLDLDGFKMVNDGFGHEAGDELLREVGVRLSAALPSAVTVSRFGGDEFGILLPGACDAAEAATTAEHVHEILARPFELSGHDVFVEASIGVVCFPLDGRDADSLLRHADLAMYQAKRAGRALSLYAPEHDPHSQRRLDLMSDLRQAIERGELRLCFQPQVRLDAPVSLDAGPAASSLEALLRWQHPRGAVPPAEFIPLAESSGFINDLTRWVISEATCAARDLRAAGLPHGVAINISARNLHHAGLVEAVADALASTGVEPNSITLELTETAVMSDALRSLDTLTRLAALGVRLSIDDFGTGYSSLAHLQRLAVHELKIDRSFVVDMLANPSNDAIVSGVIALGHSLGLCVVAEGVEDGATLEALRARHCDLAQGYHIARPMPFDETAAWLRARYAF